VHFLCGSILIKFSCEGYAPYIPGVCDSDGAMICLCLECGHLVGFDKVAVNAAVDQATLEREDSEEDNEVEYSDE
jgi:hypothetical protein